MRGKKQRFKVGKVGASLGTIISDPTAMHEHWRLVRMARKRVKKQLLKDRASFDADMAAYKRSMSKLISKLGT